MEALVSAISDFIAAMLGVLGFVGRPRQRSGIREDLKLLEELRAHPDFGPESRAHGHLANHVSDQVDRFSGVRGERFAWRTFILALLIGIPCGYWTYTIVKDGFELWSLLPGALAFFMLAGALGMVFGDSDDSEEEPQA